MAKSKLDFDKEYIFNLIMPTGPSQPPTPAWDDEPAAAPVRESAAESSPGGLLPAEENEMRDSLSVLKSRIRSRSANGVQLPTGHDLVLINLMESMVADRLDGAFDKFHCCKCDKCRHDVAALALNQLPPQYVVTTPDKVNWVIKQLPGKEVSGAIVKAILYIKNNPSH